MKSIIFALIAFLAVFSQVSAQNCGECEIVVTFVESWVENNATETQILQYLEIACSTIFSSEETTCDSILNNGISEIIQYLNQDETPEEVCTQIGFCTSNSKHSKPISPAKLTKLSNQIQQTAECSECEEFVSYIEEWMENSNNEADIITTVEVLCTYFPEWETTCDTFISYGVDDVIDYIEKEENATVVCNQVGACGASQKPKPSKVPTQSECTGCEYVIGFIENWVSSNYSVSQIETYIDAICPYIPDYSTQCTQVIAQEIPAIVQAIEDEETPADICASLGLCGSANKSMNKKVNKKH